MIARNLWASLGVCVVCPSVATAQATMNAAPDSHIAAVADYLMPRDSEIAFARSAAPPSVSRDAKVLVLTAHGYETAVPGSNGFVCLVARSWDLGVSKPSSAFWNPQVRVAKCYNPQGAETRIPQYLMKTQLAVAGMTQAEIGVREQAAWSAGTLKEDAVPGAMCYMMSNRSWGVGGPGPWRPHLMFYYPTGQAPNWGANLHGTPVAGTRESGSGATTVYYVVVPFWSDGSPGPATSK
jgi:hypothetical protein